MVPSLQSCARFVLLTASDVCGWDWELGGGARLVCKAKQRDL